MTRKNYSNPGSPRKNPHRGGARGPLRQYRDDQKTGNRNAPRSVSPMYKVDLMHHNLSGMNSPQPKPFTRPPPRQQEQKPRYPKPSRGYTNLNFEVKDEIYHKFVSLLKDKDKSPKEVLNQLISFYNMGKINI